MNAIAAARRPGSVIEPRACVTVAVTEAAGFVGRRLLERLAPSDAFTVALAPRTSRLAADLVLSGPVDQGTAAEALRDADRIVHFAGPLRPERGSYREATVAGAEAIARAARRGTVRRIVFMSHVGADPSERNEYLRSLGEAERVLSGAGCELVVVRTTHIVGAPSYGGPLVEALQPGRDGVVLVPGDGRQLVAPLLLDDAVSALLAGLEDARPGTYEVAGPEEMTLEELVLRVNRIGVVVRHVPARIARLAARFLPSLPLAAVDLMLRPSLARSGTEARNLGVSLHSVRRAWAD